MKRLKAIAKRMFLLRGSTQLALSGVEIGNNVRVYGRLRIDRSPGSTISIGDGVTLNADNKRNTLEARGAVILKTLNPGSTLTVGRDTGMTGATVSAARCVSIGDRVLIGAGVLITDSDHHVIAPPFGLSRRYLGAPTTRPEDEVVIEDDVFIGARSIVLKGTKIGSGSVIGAGSVVVGEIPPNVVAAGNPCRVLKVLG